MASTDSCPPLQSDMQRGVHGRLMDNSTSVREAAVELLGKFVLSRPQLTEQYYDMLIERILVRCPGRFILHTSLLHVRSFLCELYIEDSS